MKRYIIAGILFFVSAVSPLFAQNDMTGESGNDFSLFEKRFNTVDESINYLKTKNIDINDILTLYTETESLLREVKYTSELKDYDMAVRFLSHKLSILEDKTAERISLTKRMDLMYILMASMGAGIIIVMSIYSIYMYSRRK